MQKNSENQSNTLSQSDRSAKKRGGCEPFEGEQLDDLARAEKIDLLLIDATPNGEYALRILRAYRDKAYERWEVSGKILDNTKLLYDEMNKHQEQRAEELDKAISLLSHHTVTTKNVEFSERELLQKLQEFEPLKKFSIDTWDETDREGFYKLVSPFISPNHTIDVESGVGLGEQLYQFMHKNGMTSKEFEKSNFVQSGLWHKFIRNLKQLITESITPCKCEEWK